MFSYNAFISEAQNGWKNAGANSLLLIQDPEGRPWGTTQSGISESEMAKESQIAIEGAWGNLEKEIKTLDKVVIYIGSHGAERAIELAQKSEISSDKVVFVLCDCNIGLKLRTIKNCGYDRAQQIMCECGGRSTMSQIFRTFMETGNLGA